ncbi:sugar-binding transcriptional regulator [Streptomyces lincolnensis]|uniref:Transcriptional regulator n=1 Tax=Streptomyces lincolnensis TaxID=1915 RepID=A0A1B1M5F6_STRLN|nr:sugar-binding domain-containing protein [Streptomyces lincolnensis]ANS63875.1 transcriptional regulator [Streptomyces lincolnensis]AXG52799.1 transcriptional regulator [Streptomyces lincolnensis]QMV05729.1 transcriptional regulator [Streptomyces lincolnensis]
MNSSEEIAVSGMSAGRSAMRMGPAELVQAAAMARRFYLEGKSKIQIAEEFGVSRFKVARVLETALERDLVRIEIRVPAELDAERSDALRARYGLRHAVVVESPAEVEEATSPDPENLGEVAADLLGELVNEGDVLGLAWGRSTIHMAAALDRLPPCTVVQLTGVYDAGTAERGSVEAVRRAAQVSGGDAHPIYAPMLLPDAATAQALRHQTGIARAFEYFDKVTVACVSIGSWEPGISTVHDMLSDEERGHYASLGVAAEMSAHLFDAEGRRVGRDLGERCITVKADQLRRVPEVVAIAGGQRKAAAIDAVLRSGLVTSLVTDTSAADYLMTAGTTPKPALNRADPDGI